MQNKIILILLITLIFLSGCITINVDEKTSEPIKNNSEIVKKEPEKPEVLSIERKYEIYCATNVSFTIDSTCAEDEEIIVKVSNNAQTNIAFFAVDVKFQDGRFWGAADNNVKKGAESFTQVQHRLVLVEGFRKIEYYPMIDGGDEGYHTCYNNKKTIIRSDVTLCE